VKDYAERLRLKPADFGAHSLRAGFLTSAARRGASVFKMRDVSRHKSWTCCKPMCATPIYSGIMPELDCYNRCVAQSLRALVHSIPSTLRVIRKKPHQSACSQKLHWRASQRNQSK
jgi:hypothetical protein